MKNIQDILKRKARRGQTGEKKPLDEKTIARVFLEAAKEVVKNLKDENIRDIAIKGKIIYIKTAHPVVSSELYMRRENILEKINEITGGKAAEKIIVG